AQLQRAEHRRPHHLVARHHVGDPAVVEQVRRERDALVADDVPEAVRGVGRPHPGPVDDGLLTREQRPQQRRQVDRAILEVGVEDRGEVARRMPERRPDRRALAGVPRMAVQVDVGGQVGGGEHLRRAVVGSVVDDHDLPLVDRQGSAERVLDRGEHGGALVEDRHQDRERGHGADCRDSKGRKRGSPAHAARARLPPGGPETRTAESAPGWDEGTSVDHRSAPVAGGAAAGGCKGSVRSLGAFRPGKYIAAMPTSVVTGGAGFLGSHLCEFLVEKGHDVVCIDNLDSGTLENIDHLRGDSFTFVYHDVVEPIYVERSIDFVFHLAALASPVDYLRAPLKSLKVGSYGTHNALGLAKWKRARFLISSTSEVYGDPLEHPQAETYWGNVNPIGPRGVYDEAKRY